MSFNFLSIFLSLCMLFSSQSNVTGMKSPFVSETLTSYSTEGTLSIELNADIDEETKKEMKPFNVQSLLNALSDFKIGWESDNIAGKEGFESNAEVSFSAPDMRFSSKTYAKYENTDYEIIYDIPTVYRAFLPEEYEDAYYMTVSSENSSLNEADNKFNYAESVKLFSGAVKALFEEGSYVSEYVKDNENIFSKKGNICTISFDNKSFIDFCEAVAVEFCSNDESAAFIKQSVEVYESILKSVLPENEEFEEIYSSLENIKLLQASMLKESIPFITEFFDSIENVKIFGDKGLTVTLEFNNKGYIKNLNWSAHFLFDFYELVNGGLYREDGKKLNIDLMLIYNEKYFNHNNVNKISKPKYEKNEAVDISEWFNLFIEEINNQMVNEYEYDYYEEMKKNPDYADNVQLPADDGSITYFYNDYKIDFGENKPVIIDGTTYTELKFTDEFFSYGRYEYVNESEDVLSVNRYGVIYNITSNSDVIDYGEYSLKLTSPVKKLNGEYYVPLKSYIKAVYGKSCIWDNEKRSVFITW